MTACLTNVCRVRAEGLEFSRWKFGFIGEQITELRLQRVTVTISCLSWCCTRHEKNAWRSCAETYNHSYLLLRRCRVSPTVLWVSFSCSCNLPSTPLALLLLSFCTTCPDCKHPKPLSDSRMMDHFPAKKVLSLLKRREIHLHLRGRETERETQTLARKCLTFCNEISFDRHFRSAFGKRGIILNLSVSVNINEWIKFCYALWRHTPHTDFDFPPERQTHNDNFGLPEGWGVCKIWSCLFFRA